MRTESDINKFKRMLVNTLSEYPQEDKHNEELLQIQIKTLEWILDNKE